MTGKVYVVGNLMMLAANGGLAVQAGKIPVQTMVSPNVKVEIRANNLALAQVGDPVTVAGFYQPPDDTKVKAERITITTDRIYGETPPPKQRKSRRTTGTSAKQDDDAKELEDDKDAEIDGTTEAAIDAIE